jgi:hypothetical protein
MYVMYYMSMLRCRQLVRILVRTKHPCLKVGHHRGSSGYYLFHNSSGGVTD